MCTLSYLIYYLANNSLKNDLFRFNTMEKQYIKQTITNGKKKHYLRIITTNYKIIHIVDIQN